MNCEPLGNGITAVLSDVHRFGTDAFVLAYFSNPKQKDIACDLGSGCGIIPLLWIRESRCLRVTALEIQPDACELMRKAAELNGLHKRLEVVNGDLRDISVLPPASCDLVTMNPPYKAPLAGIQSADDASLIARHEVTCRFSDVAEAAKRLLRFGGRFCVCHRPERLADVVCSMREHGLEPKRLRTVVHQKGREPMLILAEGRKGGRPGMIIEPELVMTTDGTELTKEALTIYGSYRNK
ncbi:MAG: methyltransferase [Oscillospiraceae bacterium]|nr:methyltransferase [Oscillospiraceae bacterium]